MIPKETLGLSCIHVAQLITNSAFMQKPLAMQLCYNAFLDTAESNSELKGAYTIHIAV